VKALIVADGSLSPANLDRSWLASSDGSRPLVIAADGGASNARRLGLRPDLIVGDLDSLPADAVEQYRRDGVEVIAHQAEKDASDTELAVAEALQRGADEVVILAALGGERAEHTLANMLLLSLPQLAGRVALLVDGPTSVRVLGVAGPQELTIHGLPGDFVSLLPLSEKASGVTTGGLRYALHDALLGQGSSRGLSNEMTASAATVAVSGGRLAVIHTQRQEART
jgi:thiamine pyrophosphokinase